MDDHQERELRAEFEAWAADHLGQGYPLTMDEGAYEHAVTRWAFKAFVAGRRSSPSTQRQGEEEPAEARNAALRAAPAGQHIAELDRAADYLEQYAKYCYEVKPEDIERHPYIPSIEEAAENLRAMIAEARNEAASRFRAEGGNTSDRMAEVAHPADAPEGGKHAERLP